MVIITTFVFNSTFGYIGKRYCQLWCQLSPGCQLSIYFKEQRNVIKSPRVNTMACILGSDLFGGTMHTLARWGPCLPFFSFAQKQHTHTHSHIHTHTELGLLAVVKKNMSSFLKDYLALHIPPTEVEYDMISNKRPFSFFICKENR